jgi:hypothetical protein
VKRSATLVLFLSTAVLAGAQQSSIDVQKLQEIRAMSPEQRALLRARLEEMKKLSPDERERLRDNLKKIKSMPAEEIRRVKERTARLTDVERRELADLASGFFRWERRMGYQEGFPRGLFFQWLKREKPDTLEEIRQMEPGPGSPRVDEFIRLYHEFRGQMLVRTQEHARRHKCMRAEDVQALEDLSPKEFWPAWQELTRSCGSRKAVPGPVPPRPLEPSKK